MGAKKKNPLYVVTNDGNVVEQATSFFDALVKKFGLEPVMEIFQSILGLITDQVGNYGFFLFLQELVDEIVESLENLREKFGLIVG